MKPRYYQSEAVDAVEGGGACCGVSMATGLGKAFVLALLAHREPGCVLILVDRDELVRQLRATCETVCGEYVGVEQASERSDDERVVVGSILSVAGDRFERVMDRGWRLCVVDEAHAAANPSYTRVIDEMKRRGVKVVGLSATLFRKDGKPLPFGEPVYEMGITEGIHQGWLVPLEGHRMRLPELDLSDVEVDHGDLKRGQLDEKMAMVASGLVRAVVDRYSDRRGVIFLPGKKSAYLFAELLNRELPGSCLCLTDATPKAERRRGIEDLKAGKYRFLSNCMIALQGFDWPDCDLVVMARPTKSPRIYIQGIGRGTRTLPGLFSDDMAGADPVGIAARRAAIQGSRKPYTIIVDPVGNTGSHELFDFVDAMTKSAAKPRVRRQLADADVVKFEEIEEAVSQQEKLLQRAMAEAAARVKVTDKRAEVVEFNPFKVLQMRPDSRFTRGAAEHCTPKQKSLLQSLGVPAEGLSKAAAGRAISAVFKRREQGLASLPQLKVLQQYGVPESTRKEDASRCITYLKSKKWRAEPSEVLAVLKQGVRR